MRPRIDDSGKWILPNKLTEHGWWWSNNDIAPGLVLYIDHSGVDGELGWATQWYFFNGSDEVSWDEYRHKELVIKWWYAMVSRDNKDVVPWTVEESAVVVLESL